MLCEFGILLVGTAIFAGGGAGVAYGIAKPRYEEQQTQNRADVMKVYGTPCYINEGAVIGQQLQRVAAILVQNVASDGVVMVTALHIVFQDANLVFVESPPPPTGLCGAPQLFWVLDGDASLDYDMAVTRKLTRPEKYCGDGAAYGVITFAGLVFCVIVGYVVCAINGWCDEDTLCRKYHHWRLQREIFRIEPMRQSVGVLV